MKIDNKDNYMIIYLENIYLTNLDNRELTLKIKKIFIKLINYYHYKLNGIFDVILYENKKYGTILEIKQIDELLFREDYIDIKIKINKDKVFFFKTNDYYYLSKYKNIYYDNYNYYININDIDNYINISEFGKILYKEKDNYLSNMKLIK